MMDLSVIFIIVIIGFVAVLVAVLFYEPDFENYEPNLENYKDVELGMSEDEMLSIMGGEYSKGLFKNGRIKYEWRIEALSYSRSNVRTYRGVRKVSIYVKDGIVEEVRPYNV